MCWFQVCQIHLAGGVTVRHRSCGSSPLLSRATREPLGWEAPFTTHCLLLRKRARPRGVDLPEVCQVVPAQVQTQLGHAQWVGGAWDSLGGTLVVL